LAPGQLVKPGQAAHLGPDIFRKLAVNDHTGANGHPPLQDPFKCKREQPSTGWARNLLREPAGLTAEKNRQGAEIVLVLRHCRTAANQVSGVKFEHFRPAMPAMQRPQRRSTCIKDKQPA
jgi:hypothetical protein